MLVGEAIEILAPRETDRHAHFDCIRHEWRLAVPVEGDPGNWWERRLGNKRYFLVTSRPTWVMNQPWFTHAERRLTMGAEAKYGRITTERKAIPEDEPVFLLRAQDALASPAVRVYAALRRAAGDDEGAEQCEAVARLMEAWPVKKRPD